MCCLYICTPMQIYVFRSSQLHQQKFIKCFQIDSSSSIEELLLWLNQFFNLEDLFGYISDILVVTMHTTKVTQAFLLYITVMDSFGPCR